MSPSMDPLSNLLDATPPNVETLETIVDPEMAGIPVIPEAAGFLSLMEQMRRPRAALPGDISDPVTTIEVGGGFGGDLKLEESERSGIYSSPRGLALTFDAIPVSMTYSLSPNPRPILRSSISSEASEAMTDKGDAASTSSGPGSGGSRPESKRRSSKVRFSDELLPSVHSSPGLVALRSSGTGSVDSVMLPPVKEGEMAISPISPTFVARKSSHLRQRSSTSSLQFNSRRSSGGSLSSENVSSPSRSRFSSEDMFKPQPLPYRKLEKVLARLSVESGKGLSVSSSTDTRDSLSSSTGPRRRRSTPNSLRSSAVDTASVGRSSVFSVKSSNDSYSRPASPMELPDNEYAVPAINRSEWLDDLGISPRSMPTPMAPDMAAFDEVPVPDYCPPDIPLPPPPGCAPILERLFISSFSSLQVHKGHNRNDSETSIEMVFPLPPNRLSEQVAVVLETAEVDGHEADGEEAREAGPSDIRAPSAADSVRVETGCERSRSRPTSRRTSKGGPRSPSPAVSDVMAQALEVLRRRKSSIYPYANEEDSDIDITAPLEEAALKSRILSPNSRLLKTRHQRDGASRRSSASIASLRSGVGLTSGKGWSGSESEEEEWFTSRLQVRRVRKTIPSAFRPPPLRPTWAKQADRMSSQSTSTVDSEMSGTSTALMTPSESLEGVPVSAAPMRRVSSEIGGKSRFGWRPESTPNLKMQRASSSATVLPTPTRDVEGWGLPEKMLDEPEERRPMPTMPLPEGDNSRASSQVTTPISKYFYTSASEIEDRLSGLIGRLPFPRTVSEPVKAQQAPATKTPRIAARHSQLQLKERVKDDPQCAACRFF